MATRKPTLTTPRKQNRRQRPTQPTVPELMNTVLHQRGEQPPPGFVFLDDGVDNLYDGTDRLLDTE